MCSDFLSLCGIEQPDWFIALMLLWMIVCFLQYITLAGRVDDILLIAVFVFEILLPFAVECKWWENKGNEMAKDVKMQIFYHRYESWGNHWKDEKALPSLERIGNEAKAYLFRKKKGENNEDEKTVLRGHVRPHTHGPH